MKKILNHILIILVAVNYSCNNNLITTAHTPSDTLVDIDGNVYHTIKIGTQMWMVENLNVTHYRNGDTIPNVKSSIEWSELSIGAYCNFDNDPNIAKTYGKLYNFYAVQDERNIAPKGWHIPTNSEWNILVKFLDNTVDTTMMGNVGTDIGSKLKEAGSEHWSIPNEANNSSGFTALPGGSRRSDGSFGKSGNFGHWWCNTEDSPFGLTSGRCIDLYYKSKNLARGNGGKNIGFSLRCIKDK